MKVIRNKKSLRDILYFVGYLHLIILSLTFLLISPGCNTTHKKIIVEPVTFNHPDELIKGTDNLGDFWIAADRRVFAVMAFLNAAGYDEEVQGQEMHPIRIKVRKLISDNLIEHPEKLNRWKIYYKDRPLNLCQYIDFSLSMNTDFPFKCIRPDSELSYSWTSWELADLPEVLNDFWVTAKLEDVWAECKSDYINEIKQYDVNRMTNQMNFLWEYLRMKRKDNYTIIHIPNPLNRYHNANGHNFENYYYNVDGPGSNDGSFNIHEYLHSFVNQLVKDNYHAQKEKLDEYFRSGKDAPISVSYQTPEDWISECLIHALDYRILANMSNDQSYKKRLEAMVNSLTLEGYSILKPFYNSLDDFEKSDMPFDKYLLILFKNLPRLKSSY